MKFCLNFIIFMLTCFNLSYAIWFFVVVVVVIVVPLLFFFSSFFPGISGSAVSASLHLANWICFLYSFKMEYTCVVSEWGMEFFSCQNSPIILESRQGKFFFYLIITRKHQIKMSGQPGLHGYHTRELELQPVLFLFILRSHSERCFT